MKMTNYSPCLTRAENLKRQLGFSLIEMVMGMTVLAILAAGTTAGVLLSRRIAESNVHQNTAFTVAQGYMEQIKSMEYVLITNAVENYEENKSTVAGMGILASDAYKTNSTAAKIMLETKSIDASQFGTAVTIDIEMDAPLYIGAWVEREVLIDIRNPGESGQWEQMMPMRFRVMINNLKDTSVDIRALEITLEYEYLAKQRGADHWYGNQLNFVKSFAPTF